MTEFFIFLISIVIVIVGDGITTSLRKISNRLKEISEKMNEQQEGSQPGSEGLRGEESDL